MPGGERDERRCSDLAESTGCLPEEHPLRDPGKRGECTDTRSCERASEAVDAEGAEACEAGADDGRRSAVPQCLRVRVVHLCRERLERRLIPPDVEHPAGPDPA